MIPWDNSCRLEGKYLLRPNLRYNPCRVEGCPHVAARDDDAKRMCRRHEIEKEMVKVLWSLKHIGNGRLADAFKNKDRMLCCME